MGSCYACPRHAETWEHVPPACLFPKRKDAIGGADLRRNLIGVPACKQHNLCKAKDDEYLLYVLSLNIPSNSTAQAQVQTKLIRAIGYRPDLANAMFNNVEEVRVMDSHTGRVHEAVQVELDGARFQRTLELIALGVYRYHFGKRWRGPLTAQADFLGYPGAPDVAEIDAARVILFSLAQELFEGSARHGDNPEVFWYQVVEPRESLRCVIRLVFYGGCTVTAFFGEMNSRG